jgi:putative lipoic acid-binding regulatory protein
MTKSEANESLLEFPCSFPIKAMGRQSDEFEGLIVDLILKHAELISDETISSNISKAGNYISITAVIEATSQAQLDAIYRDLTDSELVLMAL